MGIEPTWERLHAPTPDLKSGSPTSELGASERDFIYSFGTFGKNSRYGPIRFRFSELYETSHRVYVLDFTDYYRNRNPGVCPAMPCRATCEEPRRQKHLRHGG